MSDHTYSREDRNIGPELGPSRSRSVRNPVNVETSSTAMSDATRNDVSGTDQRHESAPANSISRSMSRYRRRAPSAASTGASSNPTQTASGSAPPPIPAMPPSLDATNPPSFPLCHAEARRDVASQPAHEEESTEGMTHQSIHDHTAAVGSILQRRPREQVKIDGAERDRLLQEQKKEDLRRLEELLENSEKASGQAEKARAPLIGRFVSLARGGKDKGGVPVSTNPNLSRSGTRKAGPEVAAECPPAHIEPGGREIVPQTDAPTSAINAGDRMVAVHCLGYVLSLPVNPETTPADIISETSNWIGQHPEINAARCIVVERYGDLGLERRVRRYERIRDVMNSWDRDSQNQLVVEVTEPCENHDDLDAAWVPDGITSGFGCQLQMYQSNRPGKWNKRWVTILESGQIICSKKSNGKLADKDTVSLCHLSDYDIYTPTIEELKKHIKPPKQFCYAVKSQHKTTLFLNTEKYVQYFSTDDRSTARKFREAVFRWRSWYVLDRKLEVRDGANSGTGTSTARVNRRSLSTAPKPVTGNSRAVVAPNDPSSSHHPSTRPGDDSMSSQQEPRGGEFVGQPGIGRRLSKRAPPNATTPQVRKGESDDGFTGGLLGEQYEIRKQALADLEAKQDRLVTEGQAAADVLPNQDEGHSWFPSAAEHSATQRTGVQAAQKHERRTSLTATARRLIGFPSSSSRPAAQSVSHHRPLSPPEIPLTPYNLHKPHAPNSQVTGRPHADHRIPPKPLVDLTPKTPEAPQWSKKKKGHGVKPPEGFNHLVDFIEATEANGGPHGHNGRALRSTGSRPSRSMSLSSSAARPWSQDQDAPPVPLLGSRSQDQGRRLGGHDHRGEEEYELVERGRDLARRRDQHERDHQKRQEPYNTVPGRTGTLKVV
ncbi:hypothetical protein F5Y17DRAFT_462421 [Xylariaceae sp. FL0594]|nr:hypothetical protein F5Y17DRAFT_462421 [Xylariaceae sp. FL0594]